jgi:hypothetical protein
MSDQQQHIWAAQEQQNADIAARNRRIRRESAAWDEAHPEEADLKGWFTLIAIAVVSLILLWAHYGPIIRDAIYGA